MCKRSNTERRDDVLLPATKFAPNERDGIDDAKKTLPTWQQVKYIAVLLGYTTRLADLLTRDKERKR